MFAVISSAQVVLHIPGAYHARLAREFTLVRFFHRSGINTGKPTDCLKAQGMRIGNETGHEGQF